MTKRINRQETPVLSSEPLNTETLAPAPQQDSGRKPFEELLTGLPAWKVAALKATAKWPQGREVTQAEFDKALDAAVNGVIQ